MGVEPWLWMLLGMMVGAVLGCIVLALCSTAKTADREIDRLVEDAWDEDYRKLFDDIF